MLTSKIKKNVIISGGIDIKEWEEILKKEDICVDKIFSFFDYLPYDGLQLFIFDSLFYQKYFSQIKLFFESNSDRFSTLLLYSDGKTFDGLDEPFVEDILTQPVSRFILLKKIKAIFQNLQLQYENKHLTKELEKHSREIKDLSHISYQLMLEKDLDKLLTVILHKSREMTEADAGSLYLVEENKETKEKFLRFKLTQTDSLDISFSEFTLPISTRSMCGYVAVTGEIINVDDV